MEQLWVLRRKSNAICCLHVCSLVYLYLELISRGIGQITLFFQMCFKLIAQSSPIWVDREKNEIEKRGFNYFQRATLKHTYIRMSSLLLLHGHIWKIMLSLIWGQQVIHNDNNVIASKHTLPSHFIRYTCSTAY